MLNYVLYLSLLVVQFFLHSSAQSFFGQTGTCIYLYLSGTEGSPPWFGALSGKLLEFRLSTLA